MRQPIPQGPGGTSSTTGSLTFTYQTIPTGQTWIGTISIPGAPPSATMTATVGSLDIGTWSGSNTYGPITCGGGDTVVITATNLVPSTPYVCSWVGIVYTNEEGPLVWPASNSSTLGVYYPIVPLGSVNSVLGTTTFTVTVQSAWRSLYIAGPVVDPSLVPITPTVVGVQSLLQYTVLNTSTQSGADRYYYHVPLVPGLDQTVKVTYLGGIAGTTIYYGADFSPIEAEVNVTGGSSVAVETYAVGGATTAKVTTTTTSGVQLLAAPPTGYVHRLHLIAITTNSGSLDVTFYDSPSSFAQLHAGTNNQQTLDGLIVTTAVNVKNSAVTSTDCSVRYDVIATPTIT